VPVLQEALYLFNMLFFIIYDKIHAGLYYLVRLFVALFQFSVFSNIFTAGCPMMNYNKVVKCCFDML
jgi:hypothetical protein